MAITINFVQYCIIYNIYQDYMTIAIYLAPFFKPPFFALDTSPLRAGSGGAANPIGDSPSLSLPLSA
jgi:hypothetical protein